MPGIPRGNAQLLTPALLSELSALLFGAVIDLCGDGDEVLGATAHDGGGMVCAGFERPLPPACLEGLLHLLLFVGSRPRRSACPAFSRGGTTPDKGAMSVALAGVSFPG